MKARDLSPLEKSLSYRFRRSELLQHALTHASHAHEALAKSEDAGKLQPDDSDNERLEFLGDAVLALAASEELVQRFPDFHEGQLSKLRAHLVSQNHLVGIAGDLQLGKYLRLGRGEEKSGGRTKAALLVDALEAVIGAMYLDSGLEAARKFVRENVVLPELERMQDGGVELPVGDYKSALQEMAHATGRAQPAYVLVKEEGPQHRKTFTVEARIQKAGKRGRAEYVARASGATKKAAEQNAAHDALEYLRTVSNGVEAAPQTAERESAV
jgi:ribonuclease-3